MENQNNITNNYAMLLYSVRKELGISIGEYFYLEMIYHLSHSGWCYKSLENIADDMGITKMGLMKLRDRLIDRGLVVKNDKGWVKPSAEYVEKAHFVAVNKVSKSVNKVYNSVNKVYPDGKQSLPKINNRLIKNNIDTNEIDYLKNQSRQLMYKPDNRGKPSPAKDRIKIMLKSS